MRKRYRPSYLFTGILLVLPALAAAQSTTWTAASGDWGVGSNWSAGEPTAGVDAVFNAAGMATVSLDDEVCRGLLMGASGPALLDISSGSLTVDYATVGMAAPNLFASISTSASGNPYFTVTHSLTIGRFSDVVAGGGTITVGTSDADSLVVLGTLQLMGSPTISISNLALRDQSVLSAFVLFNGFGGFISAGTAVLNGTLKVFDSLAPNGTYEILRAESIVGTFDAVELPVAGDWSWRIEGNSVFVSKGPVPVEPTTWSGIKTGRGRR